MHHTHIGDGLTLMGSLHYTYLMQHVLLGIPWSASSSTAGLDPYCYVPISTLLNILYRMHRPKNSCMSNYQVCICQVSKSHHFPRPCHSTEYFPLISYPLMPSMISQPIYINACTMTIPIPIMLMLMLLMLLMMILTTTVTFPASGGIPSLILSLFLFPPLVVGYYLR